MPLEKKKPIIYNPKLPSELVNPNTKVVNELDSLIGKGEKLINVGGKVTTAVKVLYVPSAEDIEGVMLNKRALGGFTEFDRAVMSAVASLYLAGNEIVTPSTIYRLISGDTDETNLSETQRKQIDDSMFKLRYLNITIDFTEEAKRKYPEADIEETKIQGNAVVNTGLTVRAGGHRVDAYEIHKLPLLYAYANTIDQVLRVPLSYLSVGGNDTAERIALKHYLLRRILSKTTKMSNDVLYTTLYSVMGITEPSKTDQRTLKRIRSYIHACLQAWSEMGILKGYQVNMERRSYHSITLYKQTNQAELPPEITSLPPEPPAPYSSDLLDYINEVFSE